MYEFINKIYVRGILGVYMNGKCEISSRGRPVISMGPHNDLGKRIGVKFNGSTPTGQERCTVRVGKSEHLSEVSTRVIVILQSNYILNATSTQSFG